MNKLQFRILALVVVFALSALAPVLRGEPSTDDPQKAADLSRQADEAYDRRDYAQSAELYDAAIAAGAKGTAVHYNAACSAALAGQKDSTFRHLELLAAAVKKGEASGQNLAYLTDRVRSAQKRCRELDRSAQYGVA